MNILKEKGENVKEIITIILGALPISEVRGAIPYALKMNMSLSKAFILSVFGNFIPVIPTLLLLEPVSNYLRRYSIGDKFFTWLFARTRRHSDAIEKYEALGLAIFVGVPLPMTGAWSGCVAAFIFGLKFWRSVIAITAGIIIAAIIVSFVAVGAINLGAITGILTKSVSF
ncbi:small multi-drug export protein [Candidatus Desantisbacteria bacterium]|nr:small multi-drug export protein [Candidatus Desantisbacteria bacterium]